MDSDDEVVEEMNVFLNPKNDLYFLQYPNRHEDNTFHNHERISAQIKPQNKKLEITSAIEIINSNYDEQVGENIARSVDSCSGEFYKKQTFDKRTVTSSIIPKSHCSYYAAVVGDDGVHLSAIKELMKMKTSFDYIDISKARAELDAKKKKDEEEFDASRAVRVQSKTLESDVEKMERQKSYDTYEKKLMKENWRQLKINQVDDRIIEKEKSKLFYSYERNELIEMEEMMKASSLTYESYMDLLAPKLTLSPNKEDEKKQLKDLMLQLFKNAKILQFSSLVEIIERKSLGHVDQSFLKVAFEFCLIIKTRLIVKSEILYPPKSRSHLRGLPNDEMCNLRDYILSCFVQADYVNRMKLCQKLKEYPAEEINKVLEEVGRLEPNHGWCLRVGEDLDFLKKFQKTCERQDLLWINRIKSLNEILKIVNNDHLEYIKTTKVKSYKNIKVEILNGVSGDVP